MQGHNQTTGGNTDQFISVAKKVRRIRIQDGPSKVCAVTLEIQSRKGTKGREWGWYVHERQSNPETTKREKKKE